MYKRVYGRRKYQYRIQNRSEDVKVTDEEIDAEIALSSPGRADRVAGAARMGRGRPSKSVLPSSSPPSFVQFGSREYKHEFKKAKGVQSWDWDGTIPVCPATLTVMDFFANPHLKEHIWFDPLPKNIKKLNARIIDGINSIPETFLINACDVGVEHTVEKCLEADGDVFYNG